MTTVVFVREGAADVVVEVAGRERLLDVCDAARAPVPFSCRGATCGTCRVEVVSGGGALDAASDVEREAAAALGLGARERLACQAFVRGGDGEVRLRLAPND